ncbi:hypothetical protein JKA74_20530 [Marivirga sp. S37H4]|uniref:Secreted protein n=1 Tax=Marivirga aurantiaca TaxID=2802615 RepID=A0A934X2D6_9BACT|nr:hypothetical protein [Marivirga aurantiaca]MBK6267439.1 hypothetical protein [Marivirga aurantiaca]
MKTLKVLKFAFLFVAIFSFAGCELIEEPEFDTETGSSQQETVDMED